MATDGANELQEQCGRTTSDLSAAKKQISELQTQLAGKRDEATSDKQALAALQKAHQASVMASIHCFQAPLYPHMSPLSTPSTLATVIAMARNDWWLIVAVLASHAICALLQVKCQLI